MKNLLEGGTLLIEVQSYGMERSPLNSESVIGDLCLSDFQVEHNTLGCVVAHRFEQESNLPGVIVTRGSEVLGLISRQQFTERMSRPYGPELHMKRPIHLLLLSLQTPHLQLPSQCRIDAAVEKALHRTDLHAYDPIVVVFRDKGQVRLLDTRVLLLAHSQMLVTVNQTVQQQKQELQYYLTQIRHEQVNVEEKNALLEAQQIFTQKILNEVEESRQQLALLNEELESRVEQRTAELKQVLHDLQQTQLQLVQHEKMSALGNLVAGVAHEINNPVGFIAGNLTEAKLNFDALMHHLNLYRQRFIDPGKTIIDHAEDIDLDFILKDIPEMVASMQVGCDRIRAISRSLRTFSRADANYKIEADIHEGIDSTLMILQHRLKAQASRPTIQVIKHYGAIPKVECFLGQLNQVFMNILANAIDAIEESCSSAQLSIADSTGLPSADPTITIRTVAIANDQIAIHIADNGSGMPEEIRTRIFDHLFTTKAVGKGTGLGLSIAHQIVVDTHGGKISVQSTPGQGTEFVIHLPVQ